MNRLSLRSYQHTVNKVERNIDVYKELEKHWVIQDSKKNTWNTIAKTLPSQYEYLKKHIYEED
jgi:hypothetical protein